MLVTMIIGALFLGACHNVPAEKRDVIRRDVATVTDGDRDRLRTRLARMLLGDGSQRRDPDPHLRATAAQGLGDLRDPADTDTLLEALSGPFLDESLQVRIEAAIALGKLNYPSQGDLRRKRVLEKLRMRLAFERDETNRLQEPEYMVRSAMLNSIRALAGRDAAVALHDVARRIHSDSLNPETSVYMGPLDEGLLDLCLAGLAELTGVESRLADAHRQEHDDPEEHFTWWADRIAEMPE
jgi:hypothetical protein